MSQVYQRGSLRKVSRSGGNEVWEWRYRVRGKIRRRMRPKALTQLIDNLRKQRCLGRPRQRCLRKLSISCVSALGLIRLLILPRTRYRHSHTSLPPDLETFRSEPRWYTWLMTARSHSATPPTKQALLSVVSSRCGAVDRK